MIRLFVLFLSVFLFPLVALSQSPNVAQWQQNMLQWGQANCTYISDGVMDDAHQMALYYDGQRVFFQIADYTKDPKWLDCAVAARRDYRDYYVIPNNGTVPGYWTFAKGLAEDFLRNGDLISKNAVHLLATNSVWCIDSAYNNTNLKDPNQQRENAYCGMAQIDDWRVGNPINPRLASVFLENAILHLQHQFITKDAVYIKPFMVSLAAEFLTRYYEEISPDPRIPEILKVAADGLWTKFWVPSSSAMLYVDNPQPGDDPSAPVPDLDLLIAPMYGFVFSQTQDTTYMTEGDLLFNGGVQLAWLGGGKQFNQNYKWSQKYLEWRSIGAALVPTATPVPSPTALPTSTPKPTPTRTPTPIPTKTPTPKPTSTPTQVPCFTVNYPVLICPKK